MHTHRLLSYMYICETTFFVVHVSNDYVHVSRVPSRRMRRQVKSWRTLLEPTFLQRSSATLELSTTSWITSKKLRWERKKGYCSSVACIHGSLKTAMSHFHILYLPPHSYYIPTPHISYPTPHISYPIPHTPYPTLYISLSISHTPYYIHNIIIPYTPHLIMFHFPYLIPHTSHLILHIIISYTPHPTPTHLIHVCINITFSCF